MKHWILQYDAGLNQYYYLNTKDNTMLFDSPCEVNRKSRFFGLSSCMKTKSTSSMSSASSASSLLSKLSFKRRKSDSKEDEVVLDDEYYITNSTNFKNFAGTSLTPAEYDDMSSLESSDSIITYYSNLNSQDYQCESSSTAENTHTFNKERERMELRLQFLRELEV